ncbi:MAG: monomeric [FeFe] hydrogenase, partial [Eubacteriales bacterium]
NRSNIRCCIYKERAIVQSRIRLALGGNEEDPNIVEVLPIACDECPVTEITVGPSCRGCLATRCLNTCPKDAIKIVDHRAVIIQEKCISCGRCVTACQYSAISKNQRPCEKGCPVKAISMNPQDKKAVINPDRCIACGICANQCPFGAIADKSWITEAIGLINGSVDGGYRTYAVIAPSIAGQFAPATYNQVVTAVLQLGFNEVSEVALGADMVADQEGEELEEKGVLSSSCCPAYVDFVKLKFPDQIEVVSHTPSPMVMIGRHIKKKDPQAKVVFVGPCMAKKKEVSDPRAKGAIDCALTYEELFSLFESKQIDPTTLEETFLDEASTFGRHFARSGGVAQAVAQSMAEKESDFPLKPIPCSGIAQCEAALLKYKVGKLEGNFIEGMACEGGCVQGPGCLVRSPRNKTDVEKHAKLAGDRTIKLAVAEANK